VINSSRNILHDGWRVGWMVVPDSLVRRSSGCSRPLDLGGRNCRRSQPKRRSRALRRWKRSAGYQENRRILIEGLPKGGADQILPADGAFYLYADVSDFTSDSFAFEARCSRRRMFAATPGVDFDPVHGRAFIRFSYARSPPRCRKRVARIAHWA